MGARLPSGSAFGGRWRASAAATRASSVRGRVFAFRFESGDLAGVCAGATSLAQQLLRFQLHPKAGGFAPGPAVQWFVSSRRPSRSNRRRLASMPPFFFRPVRVR